MDIPNTTNTTAHLDVLYLSRYSAISNNQNIGAVSSSKHSNQKNLNAQISQSSQKHTVAPNSTDPDEHPIF